MAVIDAAWVVVASIGGRVYRWVSGGTSQTIDGYVYHPRLSDFTFARPTDADASIAIEIVDGTDWPAKIVDGLVLEGGVATLYRWRTGQTLFEAAIWLHGIVSDVECEEQGDGIVFSIVSSAGQTDHILDPRARIDDKTWPTDLDPGNAYIREASKGVPYLYVLGYPGHSPAIGTAAVMHVVPVVVCEYTESALLVEDSRILLSAGTLDASDVGIASVEEGFTADTFTVTTGTLDGLNRPVSRTQYSDAAASDITAPGTTEQQSLYAGYADHSTRGGGIIDPFGGGVLKGAGQAIRWAMRLARGQLAFDFDDFERHIAWFNSYRIDTWINDPEIRAWEWLTTVVLPMVPHVIVYTRAGLSIHPWRWRIARSAAVATLTEGLDASRASRPRTWREYGEPANEVTVEYRKLRADGLYLDRRTWTAEYRRPSRMRFAGDGQDDRVYPHALCTISQASYGEVYRQSIYLDHCWDNVTAERVALNVVYARALPHKVVDYTLRVPGRLAHLHRGDVIALTDAGIGWSDRPVWLWDQVVGPETGTVRVIVPHPSLALV